MVSFTLRVAASAAVVTPDFVGGLIDRYLTEALAPIAKTPVAIGRLQIAFNVAMGAGSVRS